MIEIGSTVRIDPDLHLGDDYGVYVNSDMERYRDRIATILNSHDGIYRIDLDDSMWDWTSDMFTEVSMPEVEYDESMLTEIKFLYD